jgi:hypothetical protein
MLELRTRRDRTVKRRNTVDGRPLGRLDARIPGLLLRGSTGELDLRIGIGRRDTRHRSAHGAIRPWLDERLIPRPSTIAKSVISPRLGPPRPRRRRRLKLTLTPRTIHSSHIGLLTRTIRSLDEQPMPLLSRLRCQTALACLTVAQKRACETLLTVQAPQRLLGYG